ncbi:MAG: hypothetical protein ACI9WU_002467 [Myxococcota bacterium]|jgi:hypothetical protein
MSLLAGIFGSRTRRRTIDEVLTEIETDPLNPDLHVEMARLARAAGDRLMVRRHLDLAFEYSPR